MDKNKFSQTLKQNQNQGDLEKQIKNYLGSLRKRWQEGISQFRESVEKYKSDKANGKLKGKFKTIRTALYGDVVLEPDELLLVDSFYLQRLKQISHMGLAHYVYPEARHSRFEHSLGVFWMIKRLWESPEWKKFRLDLNGQKREYWGKVRKELLYAALLHDIGHGPFSHCGEYILQCLAIDQIMRRRLYEKDESKPHERKGREMILDKDFQLGLLNLENKSYYIKEALNKLGVNPQSITQMIVGYPEENPFIPLINGPVDADKFDYYQRDAFFSGVITGNIDVEFLMRTLKYDEKTKKLYFIEKALSSLIHLMFSRDYIFSITAYHPVIRVAQSMLVVAFITALSSLDFDLQKMVLLHLEMMNDNDLLTFLDIVVSAKNENIKNNEDLRDISRNLLSRLRCRNLYKRCLTLTLEECKEYGFGLEKYDPDKNPEDLQYIDSTLRPISYLFLKELSKIKECRAKWKKIDRKEVIIFEISPKPMGIDKRKDKAEKILKKIFLKKEEKEPIISLYEILDCKTREALINGHIYYQHLLTRAILLHPLEREKRGGPTESIKKTLRQWKYLYHPHLSDKVTGELEEEVTKLKLSLESVSD